MVLLPLLHRRREAPVPVLAGVGDSAFLEQRVKDFVQSGVM